MTLILTLAANLFAGAHRAPLHPVLTLTKVNGEWVEVPVHPHRINLAIHDVFVSASRPATIPVHWDEDDVAVCGDPALALHLCENPF